MTLKVGIAYNSFFYAFQKFFPDIELVNPSDLKSYDLVIFSGGEDINPMMYGQRNTHSGYSNADRDSREQYIYNALKDTCVTSILGVCRGHQLINVMNGGNLVQDIGMDFGVKHSPNHILHWSTSCNWRNVIPNAVNSLHHQAIKNIGSGLQVLAEAEGGIIEVCSSSGGNHRNNLNILTVQFHPEFMGAVPFFQEVEKWATAWKDRYRSKDVPSTISKRKTSTTS